MSTNKVRWKRFGEQRDPLPDYVIAGAEMLLGVQFPENYRSCVRENHGAQPDPDEFSVGTSGDAWEGNIGELLSLVSMIIQFSPRVIT